jgi:hypothetical protein
VYNLKTGFGAWMLFGIVPGKIPEKCRKKCRKDTGKMLEMCERGCDECPCYLWSGEQET